MKHLAAFLVPFARSIGFLFGLGLWALLGRRVAGRHSPLGRLVFSPGLGVPEAFACAVGHLGSTKPLLDWSVKPIRKPRRKGDLLARPVRCCHFGIFGCLFGSLPYQVWSSPRGFPSFDFTGHFIAPGAWGFIFVSGHVGIASAMTAPWSTPIDPPEDFPVMPVPPEDVATFQGGPWPSLPPAGPTHSPAVLQLTPGARNLPPDDGTWLGVQVHTPHFPSTNFACQVSREDGVHHTAELVRQYTGGSIGQLYEVVMPVRPQRFPGYAEFIKFPHIIRYQQGLDSAAVMLDLTRVGGNYFPYVLPCHMGHQAFLDFVQDYIRVEADTVFVFVGGRKSPWPRPEPFAFKDGDAVVLSIHRHAEPQDTSVHDLFEPGASWGPLAHIPHLHPAQGVYVIHEGDTYFVADYHYPGVGTAKAVATRLHKSLQDITSCSFAVADFTFAGSRCYAIHCVADLPWPHSDPLQQERRDYFTICDLRALGKEPAVAHTHHPVLHIPSVAARFGLRLPRSYKLKTVGGKEVDDEVFVEGHSVLLFFAVSRTEAEHPLTAIGDSDEEAAASPPHSPAPTSNPSMDPEDHGDHRRRSIRFSPEKSGQPKFACHSTTWIALSQCTHCPTPVLVPSLLSPAYSTIMTLWR